MTAGNWAATPEGSRDLLFDECARRRRNEACITEVLCHHGYSEVMTPALEYYDTQIQSGSPLQQEQMFKLTDREGRLLVLRPDNTTPIARLVGTRLKANQPPFRLYYSQPVFRSDSSHKGLSTQRWQAGLELIGPSGADADAEVLLLALAVLKACGIDNAHLELGHAGCFDTLVSALAKQAQAAGLAAPDAAQLRDLMAKKNYPALDEALAVYGDCPAARSLHELVLLFGGREVLKQAERLQLTQPVAHLAQLMSRLGDDVPVSLDLGLVGPLNYYTGLMFQVFLPDCGVPVITGGRYDNLLGRFGAALPAVGFALDLDLLSEVRA